MSTTNESGPGVFLILQPVHPQTGEILTGDPEESRPHSSDKLGVVPFRYHPHPDRSPALFLWSYRESAQAFMDDDWFDWPAIIKEVRKPQLIELLKNTAPLELAEWVIVDAEPHEEWPEDRPPGTPIPIDLALEVAEHL